MTNKSKIIRLLSLNLAAAAFVLVGGYFSQASAQQRDPFEKPGWAKPKVVNPNPVSTQPKAEKPKPTGPPPVIPVAVPAIEQRIAYYKRLREEAAINGLEIPKVTTVLTLDEMSVTGIFRTPRGYAAMVEAKPIKLSYTIYPGEKFFDGQLVAVEENRLIFRKITKMSNNKFVSTVENKALRQYTTEQEVQGTAPVQPQSTGKTEAAVNNPQPAAVTPGSENSNSTIIPPATAPSVIISPLDEMNKQPVDTKKDAAEAEKDKKNEKTKKKSKKPVKVADNKKQ
jgi:hypothetical protein